MKKSFRFIRIVSIAFFLVFAKRVECMPVCGTVFNNISASICSGDSILLEGLYQFSAGTYSDTLMNFCGGDSIIITTLTVNPTYEITESAYLCEGEAVFVGGALRTTPGIFIDSLQSVFGCDSIVHTTVFVFPVYHVPVTTGICSGDSVLLGGLYRTSNGIFIDTLSTMNGCDSILTTTLTLYPVYFITDTVNICYGDSAYLQNTWQVYPGIYPDNFVTIHGCDSSFSRTLIIHPLPTVDLGPDTTIDYTGLPHTFSLHAGNGFAAYLWSGGQTTSSILIDSSGTYSVTVTDANGCKASDDVMVTVLLSVENISSYQEFHAYPNPASDYLNVQFYSAVEEYGLIEMTDSQGKIYFSEIGPFHPGKNSFQLDLSKLSAGLYFLRIKGDSGAITQKILRTK